MRDTKKYQLVKYLLVNGYKKYQVAKILKVTPSAVSKILKRHEEVV